ncbi:hypothetical protein THAR02_07403 [Trichoderma harzianum]|uniref:Uncharacterized protein n=1 Tax=Trichoderma harzianum TaxID=5544 RepID=A0A0F9X7H1_TRIHA|nr:hypothetical protein THAR02_07403 [Trichoderma harzianum]
MFSTAILLAAATIVAAGSQLNDCVLAGPRWPQPLHLSGSQRLLSAITDFERLLTDETLNLKPNDTAWGVALFSTKENRTLYEHYYTPPIDVGVKEVNGDSIFRIGSVSKVFSVWAFLIEAGDRYFNDPVTKYVPELANLSFPYNSSQGHRLYDDIDHVRWEDVTLGELASQAAGIARDATDGDLSAEITSFQAQGLGFPVLDKIEVPVCGVPGVTRPCTRKETFFYLLKQHPIFPSAHSPAYSNIAFTLLSYAQEAITGKSVKYAVTKSIFDSLNMTNSSFDETPSSGGVIPGNNASEVGWDLNLGQTAPSGSMYSSVNDMVKASRAILESTLISPAQTRRWLKPLIQTGYISTAVGGPWEIRNLEFSDDRIVQCYTKQGDLGSYHAALVLSPEHSLGWVVLAGGTINSNASDTRTQLFNAFGDIFLPAAEDQANQEAVVNFNGTYVDEATNSSAVIVVEDKGRPGLGIISLISHGVEIIGPESPLIGLYGAGQSGRLYPSQLKTVSRHTNGSGTYESRLGFRATFFNETKPGELEDPCLFAWTGLGAPLYGQRSLDDWVFEIGEDNKATRLDVRMLRLGLERKYK